MQENFLTSTNLFLKWPYENYVFILDRYTTHFQATVIAVLNNLFPPIVETSE
jgi:hypothetical protein